jgi:hypothetical protein
MVIIDFLKQKKPYQSPNGVDTALYVTVIDFLCLGMKKADLTAKAFKSDPRFYLDNHSPPLQTGKIALVRNVINLFRNNGIVHRSLTRFSRFSELPPERQIIL